MKLSGVHIRLAKLGRLEDRPAVIPDGERVAIRTRTIEYRSDAPESVS